MRQWKTIVLSDLHIGSDHCKTKELSNFLSNNKAEKYYLNGDIIDLTEICRGNGVWGKKESQIIRQLMSIRTEVVYIVGNHEKMLRGLLPFEMGKIKFVNSAIYQGIDGRKYFFVHGDKIKIRKNKIAKSAEDILYSLLLKVEKTYSTVRNVFKLSEQSLALFIKNNFSAVEIMETQYKLTAISSLPFDCDVIVCGHIHIPNVSEKYMNSGDFSEGCTALGEDYDGTWRIISKEEN